MAVLKWEWLKSEDTFYGDTHRAKVPGGWLVIHKQRTSSDGMGVGLTFVPDPNHEWK
jgi:hypothetical protein